jgi:phage tail-like protein
MKQTEIAQLLPEVIQRTIRDSNPLERLLEVMETMHTPVEEALDGLDRYFDPYRAPDAFVPFLATWVDLGMLLRQGSSQGGGGEEPFSPGVGRLRELVASAAYLSRWRGTRRGLLRFLETASGVSGFAIDDQVAAEAGALIPYHLQVTAPTAAQIYDTLIKQIIELEKPAYMTYELVYK